MYLMGYPVTGEDEIEEVKVPFDALAQFYNAFNNADIDEMSRNWNQSDNTAMDNPLGGIIRGWTEIKPVYEATFNSPAEVYVEFFDFSLHFAEEMFYVVGRERDYFKIKNKTIELFIRMSRIFRKSGGTWKQVHHHGSIDDPDLLKRYQKAVLKGK